MSTWKSSRGARVEIAPVYLLEHMLYFDNADEMEIVDAYIQHSPIGNKLVITILGDDERLPLLVDDMPRNAVVEIQHIESRFKLRDE